MKLRLLLSSLALSLWLVSSLAFAGVEQISEKEFRGLAEELAQKVNLFEAGWEQDPKAEFYGGTTRDYLYWLKGQFVGAKSHAEAEKVVAKLRALPMIDVRDFIIGDSDVDVISAHGAQLDAKDFGVRKIDSQSPDILNSETELGKNEILQGYIPAEKIRLAKDGLHATTLGDGVGEIYRGKLSVHFASAEDFAQSKYAREGINHPILLSLRYIRLQGINYFRSHGQEYPEAELLKAGMDEASAREVKAVIAKAMNGNELGPYLERDRFRSWLNGAIQKSFRSYTNPTAALELMKEFGVEQLAALYPEKIEPLNQYVFAKYRDEKVIKAALAKYKVDETKFFTPVTHFFPDGKLYHGTKTEEAFRGIVFQGILPSINGLGGDGLYGVALANRQFSEEWAGDKNRLLGFAVKPEAKIVDMTQGDGKIIWDASHSVHQGSESKFADLFGIDIIRYPYNTQAFVVKNASVLSRARGVYRMIKPLGQLIEEAKKTDSVRAILDMVSVNSLTKKEEEILWSTSAVTEKAVREFLYDPASVDSFKNADYVLSILESPFWKAKKIPLSDELLASWVHAGRVKLAWPTLLAEANPSPEHLALIGELSPVNYPHDYLENILAYLNKHTQDFPEFTELVLNHKLLFSAVSPSAEVKKYLRRATFTESQLVKLEKAFNDPEANDFKKRMAGEFLLHKDRSVAHVKQWFLAMYLRANKEHNRPETYLDGLSTQFSKDPDIGKALVNDIRQIFEADRTLHIIVGYAEALKDVPGMKELLLSILDSGSEQKQYWALMALARFPLNDHELALVFRKSLHQKAPYAFSLADKKLFAKRFASAEMGEETTRALLGEYFTSPAREFHAQQIRERVDPARMEAWLAKEIDSRQLSESHDLFLRINNLLPLQSKELQKRILTLALAKNHRNLIAVERARLFSAEDPEIGALLKKSILQGVTIPDTEFDEVVALWKRIPGAQPQELWEALEQNKWQFVKEVSEHGRARLQALLPLEAHISTDCAGEFSLLGGR